MKIVCENCGAKYSIADEKIKGKVFKIRCKKCSESIVIRGDVQAEQPAPVAPAAPAYAPPPMPESAIGGGEEEDGDAPTRVFDYSGYQSGGAPADEAVWHIVVDGEQQGPYTAGQLAEYVTAGNLDFETFVWREGFDDWKPIRDVADIADKVSGSPPAASPVAAVSGGGLFDQPASGGGGLFDQPASGGGGLFDQPAADAGFAGSGDDAGQDLFGGGDGGGIFASTGPAAPSPRVTEQQAMMTGARNENSVLFSLSSLQALASGVGAASSGASPGGLGAFSSGPVSKGDEASGLIDIRSLAGSVSVDRDGDGATDDILSIGGGGFAPALGAPVLTAHREGMGLGLKIGIIGGAVALAALVVVVLIVLFHTDEGPPKETGPSPEMALLLAEIEKLKVAGGSAEDVKRAEEALAAKQVEDTDRGATAAQETDDDKKDSRPASAGAKSAPGGSAKPASTAKPASGGAAAGGDSKPAATGGGSPAPSKPKSGGVSELDDLLGGGGGAPKPAKKPAAEAPSSGGGSSVPDKLSKGQVQSGMQSVAGAVKACDTANAGGTVTVQVTIAPSGRVTDASPTGASAGTPVGLCAARAVRRAKFPESQSSLNVTYPFKL